VPRVLIIVLLIVASTAATLTRLELFAGEEDVAAAPLATSTARGTFVYDPAPSAAGDVSPARRRFIARADQTCVRSDRRGQADEAAFARRVALRPDARELVTRFYVRWHTSQYRALRALGKPPEAPFAYRRWLTNLGARVRLEARYVPLMRAGRAAEAQATLEQVNALKARGDMLGRHFGLQRCTADGPGRRPIPG
jgi:hypothetical protein